MRSKPVRHREPCFGPKERPRLAALGPSAFFVLSLALLAKPSMTPPPTAPALAQTPDPAEIVARIGARIAAYPELGSWQARARSTTSRMTAEWKPKTTTAAEKIVTVDGSFWSEEIVSATETEGGRTRDVTEEMRKEARERAAKQRRSTDGERKQDQRSRGRRSLDMARDEVLPFGDDRRSGYDFTVEGSADLAGAPALLLRSRSRVRSDEKLEGLYFVDPLTYDVRRAELTLAKKPGPLKRMEMEVDFLVLPEGYLVMAKAVMRIHVNIIVKNIRIEAVETYRDHVVGKKGETR